MKKLYDDLIEMIGKDYTDDEIYICVCYLYDLRKEDPENRKWVKEQIQAVREKNKERVYYILRRL